MSTPEVAGFSFDDDNVEEFYEHGITADQVEQVLDGRYAIFPNRQGRRGDYLVIGLDHGGTFISIPIEAAYSDIVWRPVSAWPSKKSEIAKYEQKR